MTPMSPDGSPSVVYIMVSTAICLPVSGVLWAALNVALFAMVGGLQQPTYDNISTPGVEFAPIWAILTKGVRYIGIIYFGLLVPIAVAFSVLYLSCKWVTTGGVGALALYLLWRWRTR